MNLRDLAKIVGTSKPPVDAKFSNDMAFELDANFGIEFDGCPTGALAMYQVRAACGGGIDISGTEALIRLARGSSDEKRSKAIDALRVQVDGLNAAIRGSDMTERGFIVRYYDDEFGRRNVGGVVSAQYAPLTHAEFIDKMIATPGLVGATVNKYVVSPSRLDFTLILEGQRWEVDGGIKCGAKGGNGQFGDKAAGLVAMLFRLLCTNGMMDVVSESGFKRRHTGGIDLAAELARVVNAAGSMFEAAQQAMEIELDVVAALVEMYRRGVLSRGAFRKCIERIDETFHGTGVIGATTTLWGLSQSITAAARDYGFTQMNQMGQLAGQVIRQGLVGAARNHPLLDDRTDWAEILSENGRMLVTVP